MIDMLSQLVAARRVLVAGAGVTGRAVLAALAPLGTRAAVCDDDDAALDRVSAGGVEVLGTAEAAAHMGEFGLVVTSPGFPPSAPVLLAAASSGVPIWGDVELAWRLDVSGRFGPARRWLVVTGTNGKTTATSMLYAMMTAAGRSSLLCGNIGNPVLETLHQPAELLVVELSSFQLHWAPSLRPDVGVVLNVAEDHLDWHGSFRHYAAAKARALDGRVAVAGLDDPVAARLLANAAAPVRVGFRLGEPDVGELGVRDGMLVDRAFSGPGGLERSDLGIGPGGLGGERSQELPLAAVSAIGVPGPVGLLDALGAAAMARSVGVPATPIADALAAFRVGSHRAELVARVDGVAFVDDSKATNPHAAAASIAAYPRVVWVAGGLLKGASVDDLVPRVADRLVGVVVVGRDRSLVVDALSRHAPNVPVVEVVTREDVGVQGANESVVTKVVSEVARAGESVADRVMAGVVEAARRMARPGDTVLLAPAGASFDQFTGYAHRGDAFAAAVRAVSG